ncbi:MAG: hydroxymethylglutaryl-CoA synthase [Lentisphaeria bacterium]|nr:hydroxymethylglutaryl-CoA synthase [Lentisphaeria bacterium]
MVKVGIDLISFCTSSQYLDLKSLAEARGVDSSKFYDGIGQEQMCIATRDEDAVSMGANAASKIMPDCDKTSISTVLFCTESSVDQSKSGGVFIHKLLDLPNNCRVVELKQACYSATSAVQMACGLVCRNPESSVLIIASDIAHYDLDSPGESTQGCGAVALLIKQNPRVMVVEPPTGCYTSDSVDFWRPNYSKTPIVNGKKSTLTYIKSAKECWTNLSKNSAVSFDDISSFCYHLPFSKIALKAHSRVAKAGDSSKDIEALAAQLEPSLLYNKKIGNSYSASTYISFCSLLDNSRDLTNQKVAFFAFGSGSVGEFYYGTMVEGYKSVLKTVDHQAMFDQQIEIDFSTYLDLHEMRNNDQLEDCEFPQETTGEFRLAAIKNQHRVYARCEK